MSSLCEEFFYRVKKGDSVLSVSLKLKVPFTLLIADNNLFREIEEGDLLYIKGKAFFIPPSLAIALIVLPVSLTPRRKKL